jgi:hypothetical protein
MKVYVLHENLINDHFKYQSHDIFNITHELLSIINDHLNTLLFFNIKTSIDKIISFFDNLYISHKSILKNKKYEITHDNFKFDFNSFKIQNKNNNIQLSGDIDLLEKIKFNVNKLTSTNISEKKTFKKSYIPTKISPEKKYMNKEDTITTLNDILKSTSNIINKASTLTNSNNTIFKNDNEVDSNNDNEDILSKNIINKIININENNENNDNIIYKKDINKEKINDNDTVEIYKQILKLEKDTLLKKNCLIKTKEKLDKKEEKLSQYICDVHDKKRTLEKKKEKKEELKRIFKSDKKIYIKMKNQNLNENEIPDLFINKYKLFEYIDENNIVDDIDDLDYDVYINNEFVKNNLDTECNKNHIFDKDDIWSLRKINNTETETPSLTEINNIETETITPSPTEINTKTKSASYSPKKIETMVHTLTPISTKINTSILNIKNDISEPIKEIKATLPIDEILASISEDDL